MTKLNLGPMNVGPRTYVLLTALPPTKGHLKLIDFASNVSIRTEVIICTQPDEPFADKRVEALIKAVSKLPLGGFIHCNRIHKELPQEPEDSPGFWDMWAEFLHMFGFEDGDIIVASEHYGKTLAEHVNGVFMPYDINRALHPGKATAVRNALWKNFDEVLPEFQHNLRKTVTIFGAESTGKTTLSKQLAKVVNGQWLFEYARPYLENTVNEVTPTSMQAIWYGQEALQAQAYFEATDKPFIVQDTDLFSTVGYWNHSPWPGLEGTKCPKGLLRAARNLKSDLYIVLRSNIPFEPDPLRYGDGEREISDSTWTKLLQDEKLNYVVLDTRYFSDRLRQAQAACMGLFSTDNALLTNYQRRGAEYR